VSFLYLRFPFLIRRYVILGWMEEVILFIIVTGINTKLDLRNRKLRCIYMSTGLFWAEMFAATDNCAAISISSFR